MFHSVQFLPAQSALFLSWFSRCPWVKRCSKYLMWKSQGFFLLFLLEQDASLIFIKKCTWIKTYKTSWSKFCSSLINRHFWSTHCFSTIVLCIRDSNTKVLFAQGLCNHPFMTGNGNWNCGGKNNTFWHNRLLQGLCSFIILCLIHCIYIHTITLLYIPFLLPLFKSGSCN